MRLAGLVIDHAPDLAPKVKAGAITLNEAATEAEAVRDCRRPVGRDMSTRAIGAALGVSHEEVRRDSAGVTNVTPDGAALGVSVGTVHADRGVRNRTPDGAALVVSDADRGVSSETPDGEMETTAEIPQLPARVTGLDGKSYPAKATTTRQAEATEVDHLVDAATGPAHRLHAPL